MDMNTRDRDGALRRLLRRAPARGAPTKPDHDGEVVVRPLDQTDRERIERLYTGLSPESLYRRFHTPSATIRPYQLQFVLSMDGTRHIALGAERAGELIGDGRLISTAEEPAAAEVAVTVADTAQGQGVGHLLLRALARRAHRADIRRLLYTVLTDNDAALRLFAARGTTLSRAGGQLTGVIDVASILAPAANRACA